MLRGGHKLCQELGITYHPKGLVVYLVGKREGMNIA